MASLTRSTEKRSHSKVVPTTDEFPSLGQVSQTQEKKSAWGQAANQRFSDLARSWGVQQKEEEEERKRLAKERITAEQQEREREKKDRAYFRIVDPTKILYGGTTNRTSVVYDIGGDQEDMVEEVYEEEPEPDQVIEDIPYRRSKHDLY